MKKLLLPIMAALALLTGAASAQQVSISPPLPWEFVFEISPGVFVTNVTYYHLIVGEQLATNTCFLEESGDMVTWYTSAAYSCYPVDQFVVGSFPEWLDHAFYRSRNEPCTWVEPAAFGAVIDMELTPYEKSLRLRVRGKIYELVALPQPVFSQMRRYVLRLSSEGPATKTIDIRLP